MSSITVNDLMKCRMRATAFLDGSKGAAMQYRICVEHPRFSEQWSRKDRNDRGVTRWIVDGLEVPYGDLAAVCERLNAPPKEEEVP